MIALRPQHESAVSARCRSPRSMASIEVPHELRSELEAQALSIFTDMTNAGMSLQETLASIYLTGMVMGKELTR